MLKINTLKNLLYLIKSIKIITSLVVQIIISALKS